MELKADYTFPGPIARVWDLLMDPRVISACLPGCEVFEALGDDRYRVKLVAGVGAVTGTFEGTVAMAAKEPPVSYRLIVDGRGRAGFVTGEATMTLVEIVGPVGRPAGSIDPDAGVAVTVHVVGAAQVGGLIAQVGQRLLGATARMMMDRFFKCVQRRLAEPSRRSG